MSSLRWWHAWTALACWSAADATYDLHTGNTGDLILNIALTGIWLPVTIVHWKRDS